MPVIVRLTNATLYVYPDDHAPPHFHVRGPDSNAMVQIDTLQVIRGRCHRRDLAEAVAWASEPVNGAALASLWKTLNDRD